MGLERERKRERGGVRERERESDKEKEKEKGLERKRGRDFTRKTVKFELQLLNIQEIQVNGRLRSVNFL